MRTMMRTMIRWIKRGLVLVKSFEVLKKQWYDKSDRFHTMVSYHWYGYRWYQVISLEETFSPSLPLIKMTIIKQLHSLD